MAIHACLPVDWPEVDLFLRALGSLHVVYPALLLSPAAPHPRTMHQSVLLTLASHQNIWILWDPRRLFALQENCPFVQTCLGWLDCNLTSPRQSDFEGSLPSLETEFRAFLPHCRGGLIHRHYVTCCQVVIVGALAVGHPKVYGAGLWVILE